MLPRPIRLFTIIICGTSLLAVAVSFAGLSAADRIVVQRAAEVDKAYPAINTLSLASLKQTSVLEDAAQHQVGAVFTQNRTIVSLSAIPNEVQDAFVAAEDAGFWSEPGISPAGILRSAVRDVIYRGRPAGASTIPQQVVKNMVMGDPPMTMARKLDEALLALHAVDRYGRAALLEIYLNEIYLGAGSYGVAAAAQRYFGEPLSGLDVAEAALLAGMPKSPTEYNPFEHPNAAKTRRAYVLTQMRRDGMITTQQERLAANEPLLGQTAAQQSGPDDSGTILDTGSFGWAQDAAKAEFAALPISHNGDTVHLTVSATMQKLAERALQWGILRWSLSHKGWRGAIGNSPTAPRPAGTPDWLVRCEIIKVAPGSLLVLPIKDPATPVDVSLAGVVMAPGSHRPAPGDVILAGRPWPGAPWQVGDIPSVEGSIVVIDPDTGGILAMAGGFSYTPGGFDRASQSERQPGSAFKPFIYLAGAEDGLTQNSLILDAPIALSQGPDMPLWRPGDDGAQPMGLVSFSKALALSLNDAAVRMLYQTGLDQVDGVSRAFGLYPQLTTYAAALGAQDITNLQLTGAYAGLANDGVFAPPHLIASVESNGRIIWQPPAGIQIAPASAVKTVQAALEETVKDGTAASLNRLAAIYPGLGGKTGTAQQYTNDVFVGIVPHKIAVGIFIGYDTPKSLGDKAYGAEVAVPIFDWLMRRAELPAEQPGSPAGQPSS